MTVRLFEGLDYEGRSVAVSEEGFYTFGQAGGDHEVVCSVSVDDGYCVTLYERSDFTGNRVTLTCDVSDLRDPMFNFGHRALSFELFNLDTIPEERATKLASARTGAASTSYSDQR